VKKRHQVMPFLNVIIVVGLLLAACAGAISPPRLPGEAGGGAAKRTALQPIAVQDLPPAVVGISPARGEEQRLDAPVTITFDQPMDPASTRDAFTIDPEVAGAVAVTDGELVFTPDEPFARATDYRVTLETTARSSTGLALSAPVEHAFRTVGFVEVASTQPADKAIDVAADSPITVAFNRPIVPLTGVEGQGALPQPLAITPAVMGKGQWLNTGIYQFTPETGLSASTTYTATIAAGLEDVSGAVLEQDYVFSFRTTDPTIVSWRPENNINVPIQSPISVTFSMPMDRASTEEAFSLQPENLGKVEGTFSWDQNDTVMSFKPARALEFGARYRAEIDPSAMAVNRQGTLRDSASRTFGFRTVALPNVVRTEPRNGNQNADPIGSVGFFFESPMDPASFVTGTVTILPKPTRVFTGYNPYENTLWVDFPKLPTTPYTVTLSGKLADPYGNTLGEDYVLQFRTRDYDPMLEINTPGQIGTYNAYTQTEAVIAYRNVPEIRYSLYRTELEDFLRMTGAGWWEAWDRYAPSKEALVRAWSEKTTARPNRMAVQRTPLTDADGEQLAPGLYYLELSGGPDGLNRNSARRMLARTDMNVTLKAGTNEALAWVTDLKTGQPVAGAKVRFYLRDKIDMEVVTDADGVARLPEMKARELWEPMVAVATTESGSFGVVSTDWQSGISPWDFKLQGGTTLPYNAYAYTDRHIYRPGQTVYWKVIVRRDQDAQYSLPAPGQTVTVTINDDRGNQVFNQPMTLGPQGSVDGEMALATEANLGYYYLSAQLSENVSYGVGFQVAEYRKPEYELVATTDKPEYIQGEQINVTTQANYFFGGPVKDASVKWVLMSADNYFAPPDHEGYSFSDWEWYETSTPGGFGQQVSQGEGRTDSEGRFTFTVPADISQFKQGQRFTFDITVTDANNQPVSTQTSALVHKGAFYIGLMPDSYVADIAARNTMNVLTVDPQGKPVADTEVTLVINQVEWLSVREQVENGQYYWVTRAKKTAVMTDTVTTDFNGEAKLVWTPETAGEYKIEATSRDREGHAIRSAAWVWVSGETYAAWRQENNDRIQLIADKQAYEVGDTARLLVASPYRGTVKALLTVERAGILSDEVIELAGNSQVLEIPILAEHTPNAYVSVVLVKGMDETNPAPSFRVGLAELKVSPADKELQVIVTPQTEEETAEGTPQAGPRETVRYEVQTLDQGGKPISADVSLALVDKALLSLADDQAGTLMGRFYSERPLGIQTSATLAVNVDRLVEQIPEGGKGGGGGGELAAGGAVVRTEFLDLAYWDASVTTGADGKAIATITLPDNLTTWTMDARAATPDTLVGQSKTDLIATKPLLVRPGLPRFFVEGDQASIGAVIQNNTPDDLETAVSLAGAGLTLDGPAEQTITVPGNGSAKVMWPVEVDTADDTVRVRMTAEAATEDLSDVIEITLPVYGYSAPEVTGTSGQVEAGSVQLESIVVPPAAEPDRGGLEVVIEPSLAAGVRGGLTYLEHYLYECVEQTMSRFLPNVVTYIALRDLGIERPGLEADLQQQVSVGLQKIYAKQHIDGGWGWWQRDDSNLAVSAYVVFGLAKAQQAQFAVDPNVLSRGVQFLKQNLKSPAGLSGWQANQQAFAVYALAEAGAPEPNRAGALYEQREKLSIYARAYLALALAIINDEASAERIATLMAEISGEAITSATSTHWEEEWTDYWGMNTDVRTTAIVLDAMAKLDAENVLAPNTVRWLMSVREGGRWNSTQENAWTIMAMTDWMKVTGELEGDYEWRARLNGGALGEGVVTPENVEETTVLQVEMEKMLRDRANALEIERSDGPGQLYYSAYLRTYLPVEDLAPMNRGLAVSRHYRLADCGKPEGETCPPVSTARVGDVLEVVVDIIAPDTLHYVVVEDPLPAGLEALDTSLKTTSVAVAGPEMEAQEAEGRPGWWWTPTDVDLRDEKTALFATTMEPGSYRFTYQARATVPGEFLTLPPTGYQMYFPEVWGRGAGSVFTVTE
jgi:hypothetical protein